MMLEKLKENFDIIILVSFKGVLTMNNAKVIRIVGIAATVIGTAATVVSNWVEEQKNNQKIVEEVAKQVEAALNKN